MSQRCVTVTRPSLYCFCDHQDFMIFELALFLHLVVCPSEKSLGTPCPRSLDIVRPHVCHCSETEKHSSTTTEVVNVFVVFDFSVTLSSTQLVSLGLLLFEWPGRPSSSWSLLFGDRQSTALRYWSSRGAQRLGKTATTLVPSRWSFAPSPSLGGPPAAGRQRVFVGASSLCRRKFSG